MNVATVGEGGIEPRWTEEGNALDVATKVPILTWSPTTRRAKRRRKAKGSLWNARY